MSIASQHNKSQSKQSNTRTFCPIWFKIISFRDNCTFAVNLTFWMPLAGFPPKVASTVTFQNFLPKVCPGVHRDHWDHVWANLVAVFSNTKTVISQKIMVGMTWNWHTKCPAYMHTTCQNFSPLPQMVQKLLPKVSIFSFFQDPWSEFLSRPSYCAKY